MTSFPEHHEALEAELDHYIRLCHEQEKQLKRYVNLQQRSHRILSKLLDNDNVDIG